MPVLWLILISAILWNITAWMNWDPTFIMNDGIQYLSTATNWLLDQGFSTSALIYNPHFQGQLPAPQTVWPPGLPSLLVLTSYAGLNLQTTALLVNLLTNALSGLLVYLILRRCQTGQLFALCCSALFYFTTSSWHLAVSLLSEPLFTCLILAAVYWLPGNHTRHLGFTTLCGAFIAASITVRYSGIFTTAAFALGLTLVLLFCRRYGSWPIGKKVGYLISFLTLPVAAFATLMLRTHLLVGTTDRDTGVGDRKTLTETIRTFAEESSVLMGFRDGWSFRGDIDTWLFFLFVFLIASIGVATLLLLYAAHRDRRTQQNKTWTESNSEDCYTTTVVAVLITHSAAFGGYLAYCSLSSSPLNITSRYLYQIYPGLFILFSLFVGFAFAQSKRLGMPGVYLFLKLQIGCLVTLYIIAQINMIPVIKEFSGRAVDARNIVQLKVTKDIRVIDIIRSCVGDTTAASDSSPASLWSNEGIPLHFNTGVHTITLPQIYTTDSFNFERLNSDIAEYNIRLFVFVNNNHSQQGDYGLMLSSIKNWLIANQYKKLSLLQTAVESGTTVEIYSTDEQCFSPSSVLPR